jgi:membrane-associated phospholipid phosphatase
MAFPRDLDDDLSRYFTDHLPHDLGNIARLVTELGSLGVTIIALGVAAWFLPPERERRLRIATAAAALAVTEAAIRALKAVVTRPRPPADRVFARLVDTGFPSAHTARAVVVALLVFVWIDPEEPVRWAVPFFALVIAWTRVALGVNWPSDVFAGAAIAWTVAAVSHRLARKFVDGV